MLFVRALWSRAPTTGRRRPLARRTQPMVQRKGRVRPKVPSSSRHCLSQTVFCFCFFKMMRCKIDGRAELEPRPELPQAAHRQPRNKAAAAHTNENKTHTVEHALMRFDITYFVGCVFQFPRALIAWAGNGERQQGWCCPLSCDLADNIFWATV